MIKRFRLGTQIQTHDGRTVPIENLFDFREKDGLCGCVGLELTCKDIALYKQQGIYVEVGKDPIIDESRGETFHKAELYAYVDFSKEDIESLVAGRPGSLWQWRIVDEYMERSARIEQLYREDLEKRKQALKQDILDGTPYQMPNSLEEIVSPDSRPVVAKQKEVPQPSPALLPNEGETFSEKLFMPFVNSGKLAATFREMGDKLMSTYKELSWDGKCNELELSVYFYYLVALRRIGRRTFKEDGRSAFFRFIQALVFPKLRVSRRTFSTEIRKARILNYWIEKPSSTSEGHDRMNFRLVWEMFKGTSYCKELFPAGW